MRPRARSSWSACCCRRSRPAASSSSTASSTRRSPTRASPAVSGIDAVLAVNEPGAAGRPARPHAGHRRRPRRRPGAHRVADADRIEAEGLDFQQRWRRGSRRSPAAIPERVRLVDGYRDVDLVAADVRRRPSRPSPPPACGPAPERSGMFDAIPGQQPVKELFARALRDEHAQPRLPVRRPRGARQDRVRARAGVALVASCGGCGTCAECERARRGVHPTCTCSSARASASASSRSAASSRSSRSSRSPPRGASGSSPRSSTSRPRRRTSCSRASRSRPTHVYFLLVTDRLERVLPTIVSRCQLVEFRPLSDDEVLAYLREEHSGSRARRPRRWRACRRGRSSGPRGSPPTRAAPTAAAATSSMSPRRCSAPWHAEDRRRARERLPQRARPRTWPRIKDEVGRTPGGARRRARAPVPGHSATAAWHVKRAEALAKREEARLGRLAAVDALDVVAAWLRDLWVVACGASDVLWNCDRAATSSPRRPWRRPSTTAASCEATDGDAQGPVSEHRSRARLQGDVRALRGGR